MSQSFVIRKYKGDEKSILKYMHITGDEIIDLVVAMFSAAWGWSSLE